MYGGDGDDILNGGGFDDVEFTGSDRLHGGNGNDKLIGAFSNDISMAEMAMTFLMALVATVCSVVAA